MPNVPNQLFTYVTGTPPPTIDLPGDPFAVSLAYGGDGAAMTATEKRVSRKAYSDKLKD